MGIKFLEMKKIVRQTGLIVAVLFFNASSLFAVGSAGFENASFSARSLGQSNAVVARPEDPATVVFNPAGIPELKGIQFSPNLEGIAVHTFFRDAITKNRERSSPKLILIPTSFVTANLGKRFHHRVGIGAGLTFPFGLDNQYNSQANFARYQGHKNTIKLAALTLASGVKVTDKINVGAGVIYYRMFQYNQVFEYPNANILKNPTAPDGIAKTFISGDGWGWIVSLLLKPFQHHKIGIYYRSRATIRAHGRLKINGLVAGTAQGFPTTPFFETGAKTDVPLPSNLTVGYAYEPSKKWAAEFDFGWTGWHVFADQDFSFDKPNAVLKSLGRVPRNFHNSLSFHLGGHRRLSKKLDLFAGGLFYTDALPKDHVDVVIPDANRIGGSFGFTYSLSKKLDVSTTYFFLFFPKRSVNNPEAFGRTGLSIDGTYRSFTQAFMTGFTYKFGQGKVEADRDAAIKKAIEKAPLIRSIAPPSAG